jgi:hypothetical protein
MVVTEPAIQEKVASLNVSGRVCVAGFHATSIYLDGAFIPALNTCSNPPRPPRPRVNKLCSGQLQEHQPCVAIGALVFDDEAIGCFECSLAVQLNAGQGIGCQPA